MQLGLLQLEVKINFNSIKMSDICFLVDKFLYNSNNNIIYMLSHLK